jgi:hypothetical protein
MTTEELRITSLKKGADAAGTSLYVTIQTKDLRWLLEQVDAARGLTTQRANSKPSDNNQGAK